MKIYYWSPFFSKIATEKSVINSIKSVSKYSKGKIKPYLLDIIGEWKKYEKELNINKIIIKKFFKIKLIKFLPKNGFIQSRTSYLIVFFASIIKLHKLLRSEKPEYLIIHLMTFIPLILLLMFNYQTKFILRISGLPKLNIMRLFFWRLVGKKIFIVTTPTKTTAKILLEKNVFKKNSIKYLPDPVLNVDEIEKKKKVNNVIEKEVSPNSTLISIGRLTKQKNFIFLIDAFNQLQKKNSKINLFIIGEGEDRKKLEKKILKLKLEKKVFLLGYKKNIYQYLKNSMMLILPSLWEDPGFVLIEAGYMNKIILSSNCPNSTEELLDNGNNGFLFKSNSLHDFIRKFELIEKYNPKLIQQKKVSFKKKIKDYTMLNHYTLLKSILITNEN